MLSALYINFTKKVIARQKGTFTNEYFRYIVHISVQIGGLRAALEAAHGVLQELEVDRHELGHEGLQVVDGLVPLLQPVLVESSDLRNSIPGQRFGFLGGRIRFVLDGQLNFLYNAIVFSADLAELGLEFAVTDLYQLLLQGHENNLVHQWCKVVFNVQCTSVVQCSSVVLCSGLVLLRSVVL